MARISRTIEEIDRLLAEALDGSRPALARLLTEIERGADGGEHIDRALPRAPGAARTIGITGAPGAGKSTLLGALLGHLADRGERAAALMVDPTSPISGGALLGDRLRMPAVSTRPEVYVRSMASRGRAGGLSDMTRRAARCLEACGWPLVFIETVGIGQVDVDVATVADLVVVVLNPGAGDEVQMFKAGLMEIADLFVINKADHPLVTALRQDLAGMIASIPPGRPRPAVIETVATEGQGIARLAQAIAEAFEEGERTGALHERREARLAREVIDLAKSMLAHRLDALARSEAFGELCQRVLAGAETPGSAALHAVSMAVRESADRP
ncbi:MAG TPA: methylmalonyl Co-A mutase-associated GTPase MeaB [Quisquiliibacterium sp.]|nr:methylmalonyl Co-A mutase-associated GTPase MeaB [Quisquiliibacterium sp.]